MHFPLRLYGIENEFATVGQMPDGTFVSTMDNNISKLIQVRPQQHSILAQDSIQGAERVWHTNGSCTYVDIGDHPEHATPECLSVRDAVKYNKAGEILASNIFDSLYPRNIRFLLFKNNLGYDIHKDDPTVSGQFGCHENYLLYANPFSMDYDQKIQFLKPLIPFLATRQIFDGSGWWEKDMTFHLSQRAFAIENEIGTGASAGRSFFQIKTGDTGEDMRLHVVSGDANICEFALYLKLGTTLLVLTLLESGRCPIFDYKNAPGALKEISRYGDSCIHSFQMKNGVRLGALDVQLTFFEAVRAQLPFATYANNEIEAEVAHIMISWEQALNAIYNHDNEWMRGRIDYATKRWIAETQIGKTKTGDSSASSLIRKTIDIMYHCVSNPILQDYIKIKWLDRRIVNDAEIHHATLHAPPNTRARMRGIFIRMLLDKGRHTADGINWNQLNLNTGGQHHCLNLPHGLISNSDEFEKFLLLIT